VHREKLTVRENEDLLVLDDFSFRKRPGDHFTITSIDKEGRFGSE
jgi:hypothetical protein